MNTIKDPNTIWTTLAGLTSEDFTCTAWRRRRCEGADDVNMFADYGKYRIEEFNDNVRSSNLPTSTILY